MSYPANKIKYIDGQQIGSCKFIKETATKKWNRYGIFLCKCGKEFEAAINKVKCGHTSSCGCVSTEKIVKFNTTHSKSKTPEFHIWVGMKQRCHNENNPRFNEWGGRGIKVCERWVHSFENFLEDMGERPSPKHTLDRVENDKGYYKENCRWATIQEQCFNRRSNHMVAYNGVVKPLKMWTDEMSLPYDRVRQRILKLNWTPEEAFET